MEYILYQNEYQSATDELTLKVSIIMLENVLQIVNFISDLQLLLLTRLIEKIYS